MKLISLHIENFGGLSQYSLAFGDGVTVIHQPNGFGKTTLAEFIRAMFYGFPRKTKTLEKSRRQKYTPWNGGKCGGNLVFELEGQRYRIERTFGATPKSDSFKLIDLATNKKSDRFSEEIGLELFKLDADSFERSTYMPQLRDNGSLATNTIQAKLSDLVEDTGDINNFDKAIDTLKGKRSAFIPYRGSGGSVAEARNQVSRLQSELDAAERKRTDLQFSQEEIARLEGELEEKNKALGAVRADITGASEAAAAAALRREYEQLTAQQEADFEELHRLNEEYPNGMPTTEEVDQIRDVADRAAVLAGQQITTQADLDAQKYLEENRNRFGNHVPTPEELETRRKQSAAYNALLTEARSAGISRQEQVQYEKLWPVFEAGLLGAERTERLAEQNRELVKLQHSLETTALSPEDGKRLEVLKGFFASGVPERTQIETLRQNLLSSQKLRQETEQLAAQTPVVPKKQTNVLPLVLTLVLGILGITLGVVLLVKQIHLYGAIALGIGVLALIGAIFLGMRMMVSRELSGRVSPEVQTRITANRMRIEQTEATVRNFTGRYLAAEDPAGALYEIEDKLEDYQTLHRRQEGLQEKQNVLTAQISRLKQQLEQELGPCSGDFDKAILELRLAGEKFADLQARKQNAEAQRRELTARAEAVCGELTAFLQTYYEDVTPDRFGALLARLQQEGDAYLRAKAQAAALEDRRERHQEQVERCEEELNRFFTRYCLTRKTDIRHELQKIWDDMADVVEIFSRGSHLNQRLDELRAEGGDALTAPQPENIPDLESLKQQESRLNNEITQLTWQLLEQRQNRKELRTQVDRIPQIQDELADWQEKKNADQKKAQTLDDAMDFLQKAKDSLSSSYLGPIRSSFCGYMNRLAGETGEQILISPELEVQLERQGQARELAFFSAGQTDLIMLCMRLALVDALFADVKPFIILDDPFVNLDDERTAEALKLLQELGKDRQILYLVCNSSRSL